MNEKMQYATMLDIPVNTCNITYKPVKKKKAHKKTANAENVKQELLEKVNDSVEKENKVEQLTMFSENGENLPQEAVDVQEKSVEKKTFKFSIVTAQLLIICALVAAILLTNAFYPNSGINVFMRSVLGVEQTARDERVFSEFTPVLSFSDAEKVSVDNGVLSYAGKGSVYSPIDGKVSSVIKYENGKYTVEITHSDNFKTVINGLDFAYAEVGNNVFTNIPVGYMSSDGFSMCFRGENGAVITDYSVVGGEIVWAV